MAVAAIGAAQATAIVVVVEAAQTAVVATAVAATLAVEVAVEVAIEVATVESAGVVAIMQAVNPHWPDPHHPVIYS